MDEVPVCGDDALVGHISALLATCDPYEISLKQIRQQLEEKLGCDLADRKALIRQTIEDFLLNQPDGEEEAQADNVDDADESSVKAPPSKPKKENAFSRKVSLSPQLAKFMGAEYAARSAVTQQIWKHIKAKDLQNPKDRREIICDGELEALFKRKSVNMFKMTKLLAPMMKAQESLQQQQQPDSSSEGEEDEEEEEEEEEEQLDFTGRRAKAKAKAKAKEQPKSKKAKPSAPKKRKAAAEPSDEPAAKRKSGFQSEVQFSEELAAFMGSASAPRTEVTKEVWKYIKEHDLQDPADRREILCDDKLQVLFKRKRINMFKMTKALSEHMTSSSAQSKEKDKSNGNSSSSGSTGPAKREKKPSGFKQAVRFSPELAAFMGCDSAPRTEVTKEVWKHIKEHDLQNPADRREILCDHVLQGLFKQSKINMFKMTKALSELMVKDDAGSNGQEEEEDGSDVSSADSE